MKYIINGTVEYDPENGVLLSPYSTLNVITLSRVTSELLLVLIKNNHLPISREALLLALWESKGLSSSSNNLNNYMSMLRKALAECGCVDLITTIPKYGFVFGAEIERRAAIALPAISCEKAVIENDYVDAPSKQTVQPSLVFKGRGLASGPRAKILFAVALLIIFVAGIKLYDILQLRSIRSDLFQLDQCRFYSGDDQTRSMNQQDVIRRIKNLVATEKITCPVRANVYYFNDNLQDASGHAIVDELLSYCPYDSNAPCVNYYSSTHAIHDDDKK